MVAMHGRDGRMTKFVGEFRVTSTRYCNSVSLYDTTTKSHGREQLLGTFLSNNIIEFNPAQSQGPSRSSSLLLSSES